MNDVMIDMPQPRGFAEALMQATKLYTTKSMFGACCWALELSGRWTSVELDEQLKKEKS